MPTATIVLVIAAVAVIFGVMKKHHHGWVAFAAVVLGIALMNSTLATPAADIVNAFGHAAASLLQAVGLQVRG
jgi:uncharacterized protein (DUF486 family)